MFSNIIFFLLILPREVMAPPETEEKRPMTLYGNTKKCVICLGPTQNAAETPCGHVACYECLKAWGKPIVEGGHAKASCPMCNQPFGAFWHTNGRPFVFYPKGYGAKGKLRHPRRVRRRRGKKNHAAANAQNEDMEVE